MNDTGLAYADSVYIKVVGGLECCEFDATVGTDISLGKISKLGVQISSDAVTVVAKVISDEKEILLVSNFFKDNIVCFEATTQYNGELESDEDDKINNVNTVIFHDARYRRC